MDEHRSWRGLVNQVVYGIPLGNPPDDSLVDRRAAELVGQRRFLHPVEEYYTAMSEALSSGARVAPEGESEAVWRDLLTRLLAALDACRPWAEPPFRQLDATAWPEYADAPRIGQVALSRMQVQERLNRLFDKKATPPTLLIRLRTGQQLALHAPGRYTEPGVTLHATTDPAATLEAFRTLTGIQPTESD